MDEEDLKLVNDIALLDKQLQIVATNNDGVDETTSRNENKTSDYGSLPSTSLSVSLHDPHTLNNSCQAILRRIEKSLLKQLEENRKEQKILMKYLENSAKKSHSDGNAPHKIKCAGIPYFKDIDGFPQPRNEDVNERIANQELCSIDYLRRVRCWNKRDKECLKIAVMRESEPEKDGMLHFSVNEEGQIFENGNQKERITSLSNRSIDWMKISVIDLNGKYSAGECESQWRLYLTPEINKSKWTKSEIESLNTLATKYSCQNWDAIANELGTHRTGLQCCIQYQTYNSLNEGKWSAEEDAYLKELVETFSSGSYIPWTTISWYFQTRSRKQCQDRYQECLSSDLKKGAFSEAEDKIIISGAKIFSDFGKIASFLPGRVCTQIRSRYYHLIGSNMAPFTKAEDDMLMTFAKTYSKKWNKVSKHFENRSSLQCRKRYEALTRQNHLNIEERKHRTANNTNQKRNATSKRNVAQLSYKSSATKSKKSCRKKAQEKERGILEDILNYFECCSENLFGPKIRNPSDTNEINILLNQLKAVMAMFSISCDMSEKMGLIQALKNDRNFEPYDIKMLTVLTEENYSCGQSAEDNFILNGKMIPPNYTTLTGFQTLMLSRRKIVSNTLESEGLPKVPRKRSGKARISYSRAKNLFRSRFLSLFLLPMALMHMDSDEFSDEYFSKGKTKRPKKLSKKWLKAHAKFMSLINQEKRKRKREELENSLDESFIQEGVSSGGTEPIGDSVICTAVASKKTGKRARTYHATEQN